MKVNVSLDDELVDRIDEYAKQNYMSRSGLISFATNQFLNQAEVVGLIKKISFSMQKIADAGSVEADTLKELEDFERLCKVITGQN